MGKKAPNATCGPQMSVTIREASTGKKKQTNVKSCLKLEHLKKLAVWSSGEAAIPPLAAFFGHHLAASSEALGTPVDPSLFTCQRCESVLQAGYNCTIRIESNKTKTRNRRKKSVPCPQNNIVYTCHFCSHRNVKKGTPQGHMRELYPHPPKTKSTPGVHKGKTGNLGVHKRKTGNLDATTKDHPFEPTDSSKGKTGNLDATTKDHPFEPTDSTKGKTGNLDATTKDHPFEPTDSTKSKTGNLGVHKGKTGNLVATKDDHPFELTSCTSSGLTKVDSATSTPLAGSTLTLLEAKKRKRNRSAAKKPEMTSADECASRSNRRRRKSWTSLKEIAEANENDNSKRFVNLTVPFSLQ